MDSAVLMKPMIREVFDGKSVFITGANGFLGKVLLEKLLWSCPGITEVIILLNQADQISDFNAKKTKLLESSVFDRIKATNPDTLKKIHCVSGDVTKDGLALSKCAEAVVKEVSFVFHCAAVVRFEDPARTTLTINVLGVDNVARLCMDIKNLEALIHVSTAYSYCHHPLITEEAFLEKLPVSVMRKFQHMDDERLEWICSSYRKSRPSNYQYSKALAETLILKEFKSLPIIIVRPAIITGAAKEPFPGWIDNYNGPSGFIAMSCKGILKTLLARDKVNADWVPVDIVANTLIVAAYFTALKKKVNFVDEVPIINCVCPEDNLLTWNQIVDICKPLLAKYPSDDLYSVPGGIVTSSVVVHTLSKYMFHYLPALFLDVSKFSFKRKAGMIRNYNRIHGVMNYVQLYTTRRFYFSSENMKSLIQSMHPEDEKIFPINQSTLVWSEYMENYVRGVRRFFLKENESTLPSARHKMLRLKVLVLYCKILPVASVMLYLMWRIGKSNLLSKLPSRSWILNLEFKLPSLSDILKRVTFEKYEKLGLVLTS